MDFTKPHKSLCALSFFVPYLYFCIAIMWLHYKKNGKQWHFLHVKKGKRWRFSKASSSPLSLYVLAYSDVFSKCHIWLMLSMALRKMSSLNNVNNDTLKKRHFLTFSSEMIFTKLAILTLIGASSLIYFINDTFRSVIFEHFILKIYFIFFLLK